MFTPKDACLSLKTSASVGISLTVVEDVEEVASFILFPLGCCQWHESTKAHCSHTCVSRGRAVPYP